MNRFTPSKAMADKIDVIQLDLTDTSTLKNIPKDIDAAYYLVHSMTASLNYQKLERISAINFREAVKGSNLQQVIYLSGIVNETDLSAHLKSRKNVEIELNKGDYSLDT